MKRILYVHSRKASFVAIDREILAERYEVEDYYQPGRWPHPLRLYSEFVTSRVARRMIQRLAQRRTPPCWWP